MKVKYLLDTNMFSYIAKGTSPVARAEFRRLAAESDAQLCISVITEAEARYGMAKRALSTARCSAIEGLFANLQILPWDSEESAIYARAKTVMETQGQRESFVFETVFSDPARDKLTFLAEGAARSYTALLCFIGNSGPDVTEERVAMRVSRGGHDVPSEKLVSRYPPILENLREALHSLPNVWVFDNDDLRTPFRLVAVCESGRLRELHPPVPAWLHSLLPSASTD